MIWPYEVTCLQKKRKKVNVCLGGQKISMLRSQQEIILWVDLFPIPSFMIQWIGWKKHHILTYFHSRRPYKVWKIVQRLSSIYKNILGRLQFTKYMWGRLPFTKIFEVFFHLQKYWRLSFICKTAEVVFHW